jgi:acyl-coenzyme A synthetase/AMP-(fatty) acid ligase
VFKPPLYFVFPAAKNKIPLGDVPMSSIYRANTMGALIEGGHDDRHAIGAPDRSWLTHKGLRQLAARTVTDLNRMGIGRNDRVAIVLPNGPEMAAAFIAIACGATTAPLNPAYRAEEFDFYLSDLNAKALVGLARHTSSGRLCRKRRYRACVAHFRHHI